MLCTEEMGTLLSRYVDGELADKERKSIEAHLETCASCRDVLNLFQRNDNVLNNALVGEAFGAQTVDAVMTEIRRLEEPMVVAPAVDDEPAPAPVAMRQVIQVTRMWPFAAAAALMIACVGGVLAFAKFGGFGSSQDLAQMIERERQFARDEQASQRIALQAAFELNRELAQALKDLEVRSRLVSTKESTGIAYVSDQSIVVQANYSTEKFANFEVFRTREVSGGRFGPWSQLADKLTVPYFKDTTVEPGVNYMYQVRAIYRTPPAVGKSYEDSAAMVQMLPLAGGLDPRRSLKIRFIAAHPDLSHATFEVSRYENENRISQYYTVKVGEKIGGVHALEGKQVDLSTRYTLQSIVEKEEELGLSPTPLPRRTRQVTLKADPKAKGLVAASFTLMLDRDQYVPLP